VKGRLPSLAALFLAYGAANSYGIVKIAASANGSPFLKIALFDGQKIELL
jgi:hypothetical protein